MRTHIWTDMIHRPRPLHRQADCCFVLKITDNDFLCAQRPHHPILFFAMHKRAHTLYFREGLDKSPACLATSTCDKDHDLDYNQLYRTDKCRIMKGNILMADNILVKLFEHNNWANMRIIQACSLLSDDQLDAEPQSATKDNIRGTLTHLVSSQRGYLALLTLPADQRPRTPLAFTELQESLATSGEGLVAL